MKTKLIIKLSKALNYQGICKAPIKYTHWILSLSRLPIPTHRRSRDYSSIICHMMQAFFRFFAFFENVKSYCEKFFYLFPTGIRTDSGGWQGQFYKCLLSRHSFFPRKEGCGYNPQPTHSYLIVCVTRPKPSSTLPGTDLPHSCIRGSCAGNG